MPVAEAGPGTEFAVDEGLRKLFDFVSDQTMNDHDWIAMRSHLRKLRNCGAKQAGIVESVVATAKLNGITLVEAIRKITEKL